MCLRSKANLDGKKKGGGGSKKKGRLRKTTRDDGKKKGGAGRLRKGRPRKKIRNGEKCLLRSFLQTEISANVVAGVDEAKEGRKTESCKKRLLRSCPQNEIAEIVVAGVDESCKKRLLRSCPQNEIAEILVAGVDESCKKRILRSCPQNEIAANLVAELDEVCKKRPAAKNKPRAEGSTFKLTSKKEGGTKRLLRSCPQNEIAANFVAGVDEACKKRPATKNKQRAEGKALSAKRSAPSRQDKDSPPPKRAAPSPLPSTFKLTSEKEGGTKHLLHSTCPQNEIASNLVAGVDEACKKRPAAKNKQRAEGKVLSAKRSAPSRQDRDSPPPKRAPSNRSVTGCRDSLDLSPIDSKKGLVLESQISHFSIENNESNCVNESETPIDNLKLPHKEELNLCTTQVLKSTIGQTTFQEMNSLPIDNICTSTKIPHVSGFNSPVTPCNMIGNYDLTDCLPCSSSFSGDGHNIPMENGPLASETTSNNNIAGYPKTTCDELPSCIESITDDLEDIQQIIAQELNTVSTEGFSNQFCINTDEAVKVSRVQNITNSRVSPDKEMVSHQSLDDLHDNDGDLKRFPSHPDVKIVHSDIPSSLANSVPEPEPSIKMNFIESSQSSQRETIESSLRAENNLVTTLKESSATTLSNSCPNEEFSKIPKKKKNKEVSVTVDKLENATKTSPFRQKEINKPSSGPIKKSVAERVSLLEESADTTPSNSSPDKELRLKILKPTLRKKKTEEVAKTVKKAEPAIEKKSSHILRQTSSKDIIEVSKKSSIPKISYLPTLKDNNKSTKEKSSSSSFGVSLPKALQPYCRGSLLRNSCLPRCCSWKHEFTPDFFLRLYSSELQSLITTVFQEAVEVSSSFVRAVLEFFASRQLKKRILWLSGLFLKRQLFPSAIRCNQYFIEISTFLFTALNSCGIQSPLERTEIIKANKRVFASLSNETINNVLTCWGINSSKPMWPVIQPLAEMEGFILGDFLLQAVYVEIMANPHRETMKFFGNQLVKPDRQQFFIDPSRHYIIWNVIEKLPDFNLEYVANILTRKYRNIILSFNHLLCKAEQCFYRASQTRQWQSSVDCIIKALNTYKGDSRVKKAFLSIIFNIFQMNDPLINLKDILKKLTWAVKERFVVYKSFFGTLIFRFISHFARNSCWPVALGFFELFKRFNISPDSIMDMEEEPSTPLSRAMLFSEVLFHNKCHERLVKFITSPNGFTHLFQEPVQDSNSNIEKSIDRLNIYLAELIHSGEIHLALSLFRFILRKQKCNEPVSLDKYFEVIITQLIEKNGLPAEALALYSDLDSALDGHVYPSCLYLRTLLIIALRFQITDLIFDLFKKCLLAGCYPKIGMRPYTIYLLRSMTEEEMLMYIREWTIDFRSRHFDGFRPPNAWWSEDGQSPQATYKIKIDFSPNLLSDSYDASSPPVIPNVLSQVSENLSDCAQRVQTALQKMGLAMRFPSTQPPLYICFRLSEEMWGYSWDDDEE